MSTWRRTIEALFGRGADRDGAPCGKCSRGLYCLDGHAPSQEFAALPKEEAACLVPECERRPGVPCQGHMDILRYC